MNLSDFLLQRIAEDEEAAEKWSRESTSECWNCGGNTLPQAPDALSPARVLAECEAKRRIVRDWLLRDEQGQMDGGEVFGYHATGVKQAVRRLAEVYSDHPDYNPNW